MEIPSPLISKFLPASMVRGFSDSVIRKENFQIEMNCFHAALCAYFARQMHRDFRQSDVRSQVSGFIARGECLFDRVYAIDRTDSMFSLGKEEVELMQEVGSRCSIKALFPFSTTKPKDRAFVVSVAASFEHVFRRVYPLWETDGVNSLITTGILLCNVLHSVVRSDYPRAGRVARLAMEAWCLDLYEPTYASLTPAQKANPDDAMTRAMFWGASFFYAMLERKTEGERAQASLIIPHWDQEGIDLRAWLDARLAVHLAETDIGLRAESYRAVHAACRRVATQRATLARLYDAMAGLERRRALDLADIVGQIRNHPADRFYPTPDELRTMQYDIGSAANVSLFVMDDHVVLHTVAAVPEDAPQAQGAARTTQSIIAEVDSAVEPAGAVVVVNSHVDRSDAIEWREDDDEYDDDEGMAARGPKLSRNQRRRVARERRVAKEIREAEQELAEEIRQMEAELTETEQALAREALQVEQALAEDARRIKALLSDVARVRERAAADAAQDRLDWLEDKWPLMIQSANERIRKAFASRWERVRREEAVALAVRRREEEFAVTLRRREEELTLEFRRREAELILQFQRREEALSLDSRRREEERAASAASATRATVVEQLNVILEIECFICMQPIDFVADPGARYLACCDGASHACSDCIRGHRDQTNHAPRVGDLRFRFTSLVADIRRALQ